MYNSVSADVRLADKFVNKYENLWWEKLLNRLLSILKGFLRIFDEKNNSIYSDVYKYNLHAGHTQPCLLDTATVGCVFVKNRYWEIRSNQLRNADLVIPAVELAALGAELCVVLSTTCRYNRPHQFLIKQYTQACMKPTETNILTHTENHTYGYTHI
jgi:hypothetical protein